ncbi:MAG TPA: hypothetical protein HPP54_09735 [Nitrospinae bacterium]|nr:hypothetical protein [Nitrospinota bacterium]
MQWYKLPARRPARWLVSLAKIEVWGGADEAAILSFWWCILFAVGILVYSVMIEGRLDKKTNDWVKYAFILQVKGELSTDQLQYYLKKAWPYTDCRRSRIASICCRKSIFTTIDLGNKQKAHSFHGDLQIDPRVKRIWLEKLSL